MKQIITKFNDETGDFDIVTPVPFTLNDGISVLEMMIADIPKYEDTKDYNVFELIRENQELKKQLSNSHQIKAQQREFIEWLEYELRTSYKSSSRYYYFSTVLLKYKEFIGCKE